MTLLLFLAGLALLVGGAEALVRGASRLAVGLGITPLVVGLTVVALGTSSPELAVSVGAALSGQGALALGNVLGSNVFNVLCILGLSAVIVPLTVSAQLIRLDVPLMIGLSVLVLLLSLDGVLGRIEGGILVAGLVVYVTFLVVQSRRQREPRGQPPDDGSAPEGRRAAGPWVDLVLVVAGLGCLVLGSRWLVAGAVTVAQKLGVGELVIGLTLVAAGTSLPEVVTSVVAALRGERDIAVGNVVGSNVFNLLGVLGLASAVAPEGIAVAPAVLRFDLPVVIAVAFACLPIFFTGGRVDRWEGALLLAYWIVYTLYLILAASHHRALPAFSATMLWFVLPLTVVTLILVSLGEIRRRSQRSLS